MGFAGHNVLAVVPARGGSKGIQHKNLQEVGGLSLIGHAGRVVRALDWIDRAVVSTDDPDMAEEGKRHGLDAPFMRPAEHAGDRATAVGTWQHALRESERHYGMRFGITLYLEPTSPCRRPEDVLRTVETLVTEGCLAAATVSRTPGSYTPHKTLTMDQEGNIGFYLKDGADYSIRQKIPTYYHRNGICYALFRDTLMTEGVIIEKNCRAVVIDRPVVNIDEPFDLELAEFVLSRG